MEPRIGFYICHCGLNIAGSVDVKAVAEYASALPNVVVAREYTYVCSDPGQQMIKNDIKEMNLNRVVVAACSPRMHEPTFQRTIKEVGLNPYFIEVANIREHCSWPHEKEPENATEKAKELARMSVARARLLESLDPIEVEVKRSALVIGGGIAGIHASLKLADAGLNVYLIEKEPTLGGHMAQLDKTFPTLDCSACILTPMMVDVFRHPNITLLTHSEVKEVEGYVGNFRVKVLRKPRYVDEDKCSGCGECAEKCPVKNVPNEFDLGLGTRRAIYIPFPQAVPLKYTIDQENCLYFQKGICRVCEKFCMRGAINFEQTPQEVGLEVGTIIVATGFDQCDTSKIKEYGYGRYKNVMTGLEFERITNAAGPFGGKIMRLSDKKPLRSVAFILCVGSREERAEGAPYCCRYGCTATIKHAYILKSKFGKYIDVYICYTDLRTFGKGHEEFYQKVRDMGVKFIRGKPSEIKQLPDGSLFFDVFDTVTDLFLRIKVDMVILMAGLIPTKGTKELGKILKIPVGPEGFFTELHPKLKPVETVSDGIYIAGTAQGPRDITDTIAHAGNAVAAAEALMAQGVVEIPPIIAVVDEDACCGCRICEAVCEYGAITLEEGIAKTTLAKCKGCGTCAAACPSNAIRVNHSTDQQVLAMVDAAFP